MKKVIMLALIVFVSQLARAQYKPVDNGSTLKFTIGNFGFDVTGSFTGFQGKIMFDPQNASAGSFDVSIDAATVNTDNSLRDKHLKGADYFDVGNYPRIRLVSSAIGTGGKSGAYKFTGQLSIKGKSKSISFPFTATPSADGYIFRGWFKINRKDFDIGGTSTIANELEVNLNVYAAKVKPDEIK